MGIPSLKAEYPPLLDVGFHAHDLAALRELCVANPLFRKSTRREMLMCTLEQVYDNLKVYGICGHLWVDGSFLTEKIDPDDVDVILHVAGEYFDGATPEQQAVMENPELCLAVPDHLHCFLVTEHSPGHDLHVFDRFMRVYWEKQWAFGRTEHIKGIAEVELAGGVK